MKQTVRISASEKLAAWFDSRDGFFFVWLVGSYVALHLLLRLVYSPVIGTDDVSIALQAQDLAWGYEFRQPPLYTWLQWGTDRLLGVGVHSHVFLKYLLLFLTYLFFYLIGRHIFRRQSTAIVAALSLWLTYPFAVSIHQGVTHSILLSALLAASVHAFIRLEASPSLARYAMLGVVFGLGIFSKYGFLVFAIAFLVAAASLQRFRRVLLDRRMLVAVAIVLLIALPPLYWLLQRESQLVAAITALRAKTTPGVSPDPRLGNLLSLASAVVQFLAPLWIFLLWLFPRALYKATPAADPLDDYRRLLGRTLLGSLVMLAVAMLIGLLGSVQARWMHAILLLFPLYFFMRAERAYPEGVAKPGYMATLAVIPVIILLLWAGQTYLGPHMGKTTRFHIPYDLLSSHLREAMPAPGLIIAEEEYLAGNLRLGFPQSRVIAANMSFRPALSGAGPCLLVWNSDGDSGLPHAMEKFLSAPASLPPGSIRQWRAHYHHSSSKLLEVAYLTVPREQCVAGGQ